MAKYKIIPSSRNIVQSPISIGHKAEKGVEAIEFDLTAWVETYGSGTLTVIMRRWGDAIPYPIALEIDENNKAVWTLSDIDTARAGMAYAQLSYIVGETVVKKSDIYTFRVMDSLTGEGEPPEAYESWLETLTHLAAEAMAEVLDIEGVVTDKTLTVDGGIADAKATGEALAEKADQTDYNTLSDRVGRNTIALAEKADRSTTYTKAQVDQMIEDVDVETDTTLAIPGAPADSAETGRQIGLLKADLGDYFVGDEHVSVTWEAGSIDNEGQDIDSNTTVRCDYINVVENPITKIKTSESVHVALFWYDANKTYLSKGSVTINGTYELVLSTNASYVRFTAVTNNPHNVKIAKDAQAVVVNEKATVIAEAHNQIANGLCEFVCPLQRGILNTSTGVEVVNNSYVRTDYINISDYKIIGYYAPVNPGLNVIEYASDKTFVKRTLYSATGIVNINFNEATVYVRYTWIGARTLKILQSVPFMMGTEKQQIIDRSKIEIENIKNLSEQCIHHDNFSRTMTGYEIGKNSEGTLTDNSYDAVTGASSDDGVRVDNGLTIAVDNSRTPAFTVRKINAVHSANFVVEFNAPESGQGVYIIYRLADSTNFEAINVTYNGTYYGFIQRTIVNGAFGSTINHKNVYNSLGYVIKLYFLSGIIAVYIDDKFCYSFYASNIDDNLYIGAYRATTAHFDFINVFDLIPHLVWNTEYLTDDGVSALPNSTISANTNRYALDSETTRFSNKSEHFMLYSTDEKINNGRRTERSLVALIPENLRTMRYEFDVLFPASILPDTATGSYGDIFFQLHDRQSGVSRGHVPFDLSLVGNEIHFSQYYSSEQASNTLTEVVSSLNLGEVIYDKWMHFEIFIKERYEENQHPFIEIKIDGVTVYQSRKPNCANDVKGTSAQYGEYKNNWELITYSERYIDNFKVTY